MGRFVLNLLEVDFSQFGYFLLKVFDVARLMVEVIAQLVQVGFQAVKLDASLSFLGYQL